MLGARRFWQISGSLRDTLGVKMAVSNTRLCSLTRQHHDFEVLVSRWRTVLYCSPGRVHPNFGDLDHLTLLALFGEPNALGLVLREEHQMKLKYLTATKTASRSSMKSTFEVLDIGNGNCSDFVVEASWPIGCHSTCYLGTSEYIRLPKKS